MLYKFVCHPCMGAMLIFSVSFQFQYICCCRKHCFTFLKTCYVAHAQEGHWCKQSSDLLSFSGRDEEMSTYLRSILVSQKKVVQRESSRLHALGKEQGVLSLRIQDKEEQTLLQRELHCWQNSYLELRQMKFLLVGGQTQSHNCVYYQKSNNDVTFSLTEVEIWLC